MMSIRYRFPSVLLVVSFLLAGGVTLAQKKKDRRKDFGASVRRLKWDPEIKQAGETNAPTPTTTDDDVVRVETSLVATDLLVLDRQGKAVTGLVAADFIVSEDDVPQQVGHFLLGGNTGVSRSIVLLIDYSGSQFAYIRDSVEAAKILVDSLGRNDRMAIITDDIAMLVDFTTDKRELKKHLDSLVEKSKGSDGFLGLGGTRRKFGNSAQYSALMATLKEAFDEEDQRPIVIFQTDGDEAMYLRNSIVNPAVPEGVPPEMFAQVQEEVEQRRKLQRDGMTEFSLDDVYREAEKSRATIYTVIPGPRLIGLSKERQAQVVKGEDERAVAEMMPTLSKKTREAFEAREEARKRFVPPVIFEMRAEELGRVQEALAALAPLTGGWTEFLESPSQASSIYRRILSDINQRYIIGYYPTNKARDGQRRKLHFEVKGHPDYTIQGRKSYLAPKN
jgi:VWFA-related protein